MTISAAGFGRRIHWEDDEASPGHNLNFKRSVEAVGTGLYIRLFSPKWIFEWGPIQKIRDARDGFAEFRVCFATSSYRCSLADIRSRIWSR